MDKRKSLRLLVMVGTAILLLAETSGSKVMAGGKQPYTPTMVVTPYIVPLGSTTITISGSGFKPYQFLSINTWFIPQSYVATDGNGAFSFDYSPPSSAGFYIPGPSSVQAIEVQHRKRIVVATATYVVQ